MPASLSNLLDASSLAWLLFGLWFAKSLRSLYADEYRPAKKRFMAVLGVIYLPWILSTPVLQLLVQVLDPWVRAKVLAGVGLTLTCLAYAVMAYFLDASRAGAYFDTSIAAVKSFEMSPGDLNRDF